MRLLTYILIATIGLLPAMVQAGGELKLVPTFENCSVYVEGLRRSAAELTIQYRTVGSDWQDAQPLVDSKNDRTPRCSLLGLQPDTEYEVWCRDEEGVVVAAGRVRTWADTVPIARTIKLSEVNPDGGPYLIDQNGTPDGWIRYVGEPGYVLDGGDVDTEAILIDGASYVIVENLTVRGGRRHGFQVKNSHHVRISNCDIAGYGRIGEQDLERKGKYYEPGAEKAINYDSGVYIDLASEVVVERCHMHDPRGTANSWFYSHPEGPNGIFVRSGGSLVIRYNDLIGSHDKRWNDAIEGYGNRNVDGGFNQDADVYGNFLAFMNDDGIELDGGQCNVRFYDNRVEGGLCGISTAPNLRGPSYIFRNVVMYLGDGRGMASAAVKNGGGTSASLGISHFYNNTFFTRGSGIKGVGFGKDKNRQMFLGVSRNNLFAVGGPGISDGFVGPHSDYASDFFTTPNGQPGSWSLAGQDAPQAIRGDAQLLAGAQGDFRLRDGSPALGGGVRVPGLHAPGAVVHHGAFGPVGSAGMTPARPIPVDASHYRVALSTSTPDAGSATVTLTSRDPDTAMSFRVDTGESADWYTVSPASGEIAPGGSTTLTVTLAPDLSTDIAMRLGGLRVVFADGMALPISVYGETPTVTYESYVEVEDLPGAAPFASDEHDGSASGVALEFDAEVKVDGQAAALTWNLQLPAAGRYYVYFRVKCPEPVPLHDSLWLTVGDGEPIRTPIVGAGSEGWTWVAYNGVGPYLELPAGESQLRLSPRESLYLDAVLIRTTPLPLHVDPASN